MKKLLGILAFGSVLAAQSLLAQPARQERDIVRITQEDIQHSKGYTRLSGKERERVDNALRHLSEFDAKYAHGDFDKGKLDEAIDDVKNVTENNPLGGEDRDRLLDDLQRLRDFRKRHG